MTTIAAVIHAGRVHMGGDSAVTEDASVWLTGQPKCFRAGPVLIGVLGSSPWESALRTLEFQRQPGADREAWLRDELPARVREAVETQVPEGEERTSSEALIGFDGRLWCLEYSGALWPIAGAWTALGAGADAARAVLRYTARRAVRAALKLAPRDRLQAALEAAEALTEGTRRPFRYVNEK